MPPTDTPPSIEQRRAALEARVPAWRETTMDAAFASLVEEFRDRPYVIGEEATYSYGEVWDRAEKIAKGLVANGIRPGDHVALLMANHAEFVPVAWAVWRLGAILIPLNFAFRGEELKYVLRQSGARLLITMASFRDLDYVAMLDVIAPGWETDPAQTFPEMLQVVLHGETDRAAKGYEALIADGEAGGTMLPKHDAQPLDTALIMYTSGTTGLPKGVIQTHDGILRISYVEAYHMGYHDGQRTLFALPLYHAFGMVVGVISAIWVGGAVVPQLVFDPVQTFRDIEKHKANFALFVPTMVMALIEHPDRGKYDLSSVTGVLSGAAPTPVRAWQQLIDLFGLDEVFTGYGMTEHSCATVLTRAGDPLELVESTVGRPMDAGAAGPGGVVGEFRTVDPYSLEFLPDGEEGELVFRGPTATPGYFRNPELTAELLMADGWVRSGDLGRIRPDGYIQLTGRSKELYKTGGELVAPREVEDVLDQHPDVAQSFVIGIPDERWGEIGGAWVVPVAGKTPDPAELQEWCRERLAKYKWPRHIFFSDAESLPKTPTGKIQKFQLVKRSTQLLEEQGASAAE